MLGQIDLTLIPVSQFEEIEVLYGASSLTRTTGAFGGVINLVTKPDWNNRIFTSLSQTIASFDNYTTNLNVVAGTGSFQSSTKVNFNSAVNDFPYYNDYTGEHVTQHDASGVQYGFSEEAFAKIRDKHLLTGRVWYSYDDRDIPPTVSLTPTNYVQKQLDKTLRSILDYKYVEKDWNIFFRTALINQFMNYRNDSMKLDEDHYSSSWINSLRFTYTRIKNLTIKPGLDYTYDHAKSDAYTGIKTRNTIGAYAEVSYIFSGHFKSQLILREDYLESKFMPFVPALGLEYKPFIKINLFLTANANRNYGYPTLDDLYWNVWGNPDLKPEYDKAFETGVNYNYPSKNGNFFIESSVTGYYSWMTDMIEWSPIPGNSSIWKPQNIQEVLARGMELSLNLKLKISKLTITSSNSYSYCRSTYQQATSAMDQSVGKQLMYVPENMFNGTLSMNFFNFNVGYNFSFVDKRYTSSDNQYFMPGYSLSNIILGKAFIMKHFVLSLQVKINNVFNVDYQSVENWPMPGRNYALNIRFECKK
jgi:iron complex outermembrane receptor protein